MTKGFTSPKNKKTFDSSNMNQDDIKEVVKTYFDRSPGQNLKFQSGQTQLMAPGSPYTNFNPPTSAFSIEKVGANDFGGIVVGAFNTSNTKQPTPLKLRD